MNNQKLDLASLVSLPTVAVETTIKRDTILAISIAILLTISLALLIFKVVK